MVERDYQPRSFKDVLREMKDISELMVDLSYSAILFENKEIAEEVLDLEESMNTLGFQARIASILGARRVEEAEEMSGLLQVAESSGRIANSASRIAEIVLSEIKVPASIKKALPEAEEATVRLIVGDSSELADRTLGDVKLQSRTGMRVIGIRRGFSWIYDPDKWSAVKAGDILLAKGPLAGVAPLHEIAGAKTAPVADAVPASLVDDLDRAARMIVELKNLSELAVNLAYTCLLLSSKEVAREVRLLDDRIRAMRADLDLWILQAARRVDYVGDLRGLLLMSASSEDIGEAASEIADVILRDIEIPPLFAKIIRESDEIISRVTVRGDSSLAGRSLGEASLGTVTGMVVIAIKSGDRWTYRPKKTDVINAGDVIIAKGRRDGECRLMHLSGSVSEMGAECGE